MLLINVFFEIVVYVLYHFHKYRTQNIFYNNFFEKSRKNYELAFASIILFSKVMYLNKGASLLVFSDLLIIYVCDCRLS